MKAMVMLGLTLVLALAGCGGSGTKSATDEETQRQAEMFAIDQIEKTWHQASSTHDVNLMMTVWAPDATFTFGTKTYSGTAQIRDLFKNTVKAFRPQNHWVSETPAYKIRITQNGDKGTIYFQCDYVDVKTRKVVSSVAADSMVQKINGKWLITSSAGAPATIAS